MASQAGEAPRLRISLLSRYTHRVAIAMQRLDPNPPAHPWQPNPHSARRTALRPLRAVSSLGGFRTPARTVRGTVNHLPSLPERGVSNRFLFLSTVRSQSENTPKRGYRKTPAADALIRAVKRRNHHSHTAWQFVVRCPGALPLSSPTACEPVPASRSSSADRHKALVRHLPSRDRHAAPPAIISAPAALWLWRVPRFLKYRGRPRCIRVRL